MDGDILLRIRAPHTKSTWEILGAFNARDGDNLPGQSKALIMLGPNEPGFWSHVTAEPEFLDDNPNPLDRWSSREIGDLANMFNCRALFPFGGPPYNPFFTWALRTGRCWQSPVKLLVHDVAGLFISFRGALAVNEPVRSRQNPNQAPAIRAFRDHA